MSDFWCAENLVKLRKCAENVKNMLKGLKGIQNGIIFSLLGGVCVCVCERLSWGQFHQRAYMQLLRAQIPKA